MTLEPLVLNGNMGLGVSILIGIAFGFTLVKSDFAWDDSCVKLLALRNGRLLKILLLTFLFGIVAFHFAKRWGLVNFQLSPAYLYSVILGGIVSGAGLAIGGFFPAGALASLGAGRLYALWMIAGMVAAMIAKRVLERVIEPPWNWGEMLPLPRVAGEAFGIGNWVWPIAAALLAMTVIVHIFLPEDDD